MNKTAIKILVDSVNDNTGDKAILKSLEQILEEEGITYEISNPKKALTNDSSVYIIGGGHLLRDLKDPFYDSFRVKGHHILNSMGLTTEENLGYLSEYQYITVRSKPDYQRIKNIRNDIFITPCTSMLLKPKENKIDIPKNSIGIHIHHATIEAIPNIVEILNGEEFQPYTKILIPFTHYNKDYLLLEHLQTLIKNSILIPRLEPQELLSLISELKYFICSSLHASIFAYVNKIPFITFPYHEKITSFMEERALGEFKYRNGEELLLAFTKIEESKSIIEQFLPIDKKQLEFHTQIIKGLVTNRLSSKELNVYKELVSSFSHLREITADQRTLQNNIKSLQKEDLQQKTLIREKDLHIHNIETTSNKKDVHIKSLELIVKTTQQVSKEQKDFIKDQHNKISVLYEKSLEKDTHIKNLESELLKIKTSITWKLLTVYKHVTTILLHPKQKIIRFIKSIKIIGVKATFRNIYRKTFPNNNIIQDSRALSETQQYEYWLKQNDLTRKELEQKKKELKDLNYIPLISIIMPVYNVDKKWLSKAIQSVQNQIYKNWELCINDDASTKEYIKPLLKEFERKDKRIKVKYSKVNQHISGASNEALKLASGEFIALMDNDDEIPTTALFEVVKKLNEDSELDFIYSDEDKLDEKGNRVEPFFKPDWSPDYFLSTMYTCHLGVYRKTLVDKIKGFRKGYEGAQDYDLVLRLTELTDRIYHIPKILYHWRKIRGSTSSEYSEKSYAKSSAKKALSDAIQRRQIKAKVLSGRTPESFRIKYKIKDNPLISIIIPTWNKKTVLERCIESIEKKTTYKNYELLIIDNRSDDPDTIEYLKELSKKHNVIKYNKPFNFSALNNFAIKKAKGDYILFLNNDTEVISSEWLSAMLEHAQRKEIGAVGSKLLYPNGQLQHAGVNLGIGNHGIDGIAGHAFKYMTANQNNYTNLGVYKNRMNMICNYSAVTAACLMMRKELFKDIGGFNEKELTIAFNDIDLCLRIIQRGYQIVYTPYSELYHHESISRGTEDNSQKQARFKKECDYMLETWGDKLKKDSFYNPNLTKAHEDYSINI